MGVHSAVCSAPDFYTTVRIYHTFNSHYGTNFLAHNFFSPHMAAVDYYNSNTIRTKFYITQDDWANEFEVLFPSITGVYWTYPLTLFPAISGDVSPYLINVSNTSGSAAWLHRVYMYDLTDNTFYDKTGNMADWLSPRLEMESSRTGANKATVFWGLESS